MASANGHASKKAAREAADEDTVMTEAWEDEESAYQTPVPPAGYTPLLHEPSFATRSTVAEFDTEIEPVRVPVMVDSPVEAIEHAIAALDGKPDGLDRPSVISADDDDDERLDYEDVSDDAEAADVPAVDALASEPSIADLALETSDYGEAEAVREAEVDVLDVDGSPAKTEGVEFAAAADGGLSEDRGDSGHEDVGLKAWVAAEPATESAGDSHASQPDRVSGVQRGLVVAVVVLAVLVVVLLVVLLVR